MGDVPLWETFLEARLAMMREFRREGMGIDMIAATLSMVPSQALSIFEATDLLDRERANPCGDTSTSQASTSTATPSGSASTSGGTPASPPIARSDPNACEEPPWPWCECCKLNGARCRGCLNVWATDPRNRKASPSSNASVDPLDGPREHTCTLTATTVDADIDVSAPSPEHAKRK